MPRTIVTTGTQQDDQLVGKTYYTIGWQGPIIEHINDVIDGLGGHDTIDGRGGDDSLDGGEGRDSLIGGDGFDTLEGGRDRDTLDGGADDDLLLGGRGNDRLFGRDGHDRMYGGFDHDRLEGGDGNDLLDGMDGDDTLEGGMGHDTLIRSTGVDKLYGGKGNDLFEDNGDVANQFFSYTEFHGGEGIDTIDLTNFDGNMGLVDGISYTEVEFIRTGSGDDSIRDLLGNVTINTNSGNDTVEGGMGADYLNGGADFDTVRYTDSGAGVRIYTSGSLAQNGYGGEAQGDILREFEKYELSKFNDQLYGNARDEEILLDEGHDYASGDGGNDTIFGGTGRDTINGGTGDDIMTGGRDGDNFWFDADTDFGHDRITDYKNGPDKITIDANYKFIGRTTVRNDGDDAVITVAGRDASITLEGAAGQITIEDLIFTGSAWEPIDFDFGFGF